MLRAFDLLATSTCKARKLWQAPRLSITSLRDILTPFPLSPRTGCGSPKDPPRGLTSRVLDRLERAHHCLTRADAHNVDELIRDTHRHRIQRMPSTLLNAGDGLFLSEGRIKSGDVLTLFPGLIYQIPYDLAACMHVDHVTSIPRPPDFLVNNQYLMRFHHKGTNQHLLVDGCPRGVSALNFIRASMAAPGRGGRNLDWLDTDNKTSGPDRSPQLQLQGPSYFTAALGLGHIANDPEDEDLVNAELHLIELPSDLPPRLKRLLPNAHFSDRLGPRLFTVVLMASEDLEASLKAPPIELFVSYGREPHRPGYPL